MSNFLEYIYAYRVRRSSVCWWYLMIALAHFSTSSLSSSHSFVWSDLFLLRRDSALMVSILALSLLIPDASFSMVSAPCPVSASLLRFSGGSLSPSPSPSFPPSILSALSSSELLSFWQSLPWLSLQIPSPSSASSSFRSIVWRRLRIGRPLASLSGECYSHSYNRQ